MFKLLNKKKNNKGFTLVELVIVIAILAILVGILAPQYTKYVEKSRKAADVDNLEELVKAVQVYVIDGASNNKAKAEDITIKISPSGVDFGSNATAEAAFKEYVPNYTNIQLKGNHWDGDFISEKLTITAEGGITISEYKPDELTTYIKTGAGKTATTTAGN